MKKHLIIIAVAALSALAPLGSSAQELPVWAEKDSAQAISSRINRDFPWTLEEAWVKFKEKYPKMTRKEFEKAVVKGWIETRKIGGRAYVHRKALGNYALLNPSVSKFKGRGATSSEKRQKYVKDVLSQSIGAGELVDTKNFTIRFSLDVPTDGVAVKEGDTLRMWLPYPLENERQSNRKLISTSHPVKVADASSPHSTLFFEVPVTGDTTKIEYVASFNGSGRYFSPEFIEHSVRPYNKNSELYKKYTSFEAPNIVRLDSLAQAIVGSETDPFRQSELVYDWIIKNMPWAGALEYSIIDCIPQYVLEQGHGDCGQVALLYISLMRSLGVPARWESGWMFHPGEKNLHDWAEVYFEGVGWVPVDASFGRYSNSDDPAVRNFYSTGTDPYHIAMNTGVGGQMSPAKKYVRSETVDSQMGEVETQDYNLFYPGWSSSLQIISEEPVETAWALPRVSAAMMRATPAHASELISQAIMGMPVRIIEEGDDWIKIATPDGYTGWVTAGSLVPKTNAEMAAWRTAPRLVVKSIPQINVYSSPEARGARDVVSDLVNGSIVEGVMTTDGSPVKVTLPDGRTGWVDAENVETIETWASQPFDPEKILNLAYSIEGTPYLWGANTTKALDCSGLVKTGYLSNGIIMRRDAWQQARTGRRVEPSDWRSLEPGDLLFFGNPKTQRVTHVAIYDKDGNYIHSSGRVKRNSIDPQSKSYLSTPFLHAVSMKDQVGTFGITPAISHPWYFNQK